VQHDEAEHRRGERLGEREGRHGRRAQAAQARTEQEIGDRDGDDAEPQGERDAVRGVQPRGRGRQEHGQTQHRGGPEHSPITAGAVQPRSSSILLAIA
jgi:hypothetical protein